ncbi:type I-G CRISPR-associated helicase/endonuclease Cas3g [Actinacidiphila oryziradicis]|uniref:Type I-U CRISPR-associated helicase/endonuclease Cas3 n=1 Tax=Actinacidiphila oryziradicis TaxID=2571141 RepID=A0A4U0RU56_9ACTN|nr:type I-U CRISPR-associated helicase/endonuclease Cas3 [Actinacidiphila oryziradicis]TJZ98997.1 type I-U CRISPR-associated helicase/endonuclease Cas3 [Actinacidiphila oryziradicis]
MSDLIELDEFPAFVREAFGYLPFPWQQAYLRAVATGADWPDLDVPTALGKTSLIDIWVFLLAWQTALGGERTIPLRLFFAVDRRLVVDQAHEHAERLADVLVQAEPGSVCGRVAAALRELGGEDEPFSVVRMRGGVDWASRWLRSPAQPAVVVSTVDQYGSRLLFRGYHTSPRMRPIDAALTGFDALLALDEAHLSQALLTTARDCAAYQATATDPEFAARAVKVVSLSATADDSGRPRLGVGPEDRAHPVAGRRLHANRRVTLLDVSAWAKNPTEAFAYGAIASVDALLPVIERPVVAVVANTIASARAAFQALSARDDLDVLLLTGRCRDAERTNLIEGPLSELLNGVDPHRPRPLVVVATQTIEVGLDVTVAGMCIEAAAWDAVLQRLGRLDRTGDLALAPAVVLRAHAPDDVRTIPVYGEAAACTWDWLASHTPVLDQPDATEELQHALTNGLLLNPATLPGLRTGIDISALTAPSPRIPVVHRTVLDSWARTDPAPVPDQAPAPFLHGLDTSPADVQVLWRADLPWEDGTTPPWEVWAARLAQTPPHPGETVAVPVRRLRRFLARQADAAACADLEGAPDPEQTPTKRSPAQPRLLPAMRWDGPGAWAPALTPGDVRPGCTVILPAAVGGHDAFGWTGVTGPGVVPDLGDFSPGRELAATRLDAEVMASVTGKAEHGTELRALLRRAIGRLQPGDDQEPATEVVRDLLTAIIDRLPTDPPEPTQAGRFTQRLLGRLVLLRGAVAQWDLSGSARSGAGRVVMGTAPDDVRMILLPPHLPTGTTERIPGVGDEEADSSSLTRPVALAQHGKAVGARAADFAQRIGLSKQSVAAVEIAGEAHDCGKQHPRFQSMLCGGDALLAEALPEPLAKSGMDPADVIGRRTAARLAGWDPGLRHEALSAAAVQRWFGNEPAIAAGLDKMLITHLVAAHHGRSRPLLPPVTDPEPVEVECTMPDGQQITVTSAAMGVDWDGPDRFAALMHRYGPWGTAVLESIVRLADMSCSEEGS